MSTEVAVQESLYRKEPKVYPREVKGRFDRLRKLAVVVLLGLYYFLPWLNWDGRQAVLFDLPARQFYIFGITFWPQDFIYLALLLVIAGLSLFFFTALAGRLWCGFACPQTVWTEAFLLMEKWTEGNHLQGMKLDQAPWSANKVARKASKQFLWIGFAAWTGFTFVGFFTPIRELGWSTVHFSLGGWETFWMVFYSFATYGNAGYLREQVCKYMCPYARFQGAMFDRDTLIISYDEGRGEPRGGRSKNTDRAEAGLGDCIDCTLCVQVCPTGIDIRNGLQYECIACAACVDVCDQVMDKMDYPRGLIRYTTENALQGRASKILRPRVLIYGALLGLLIAGLALSIAQRTPLRAELIRDRNVLYRELSDGQVENVYSLKLINMDRRTHKYRISVAGNPAVTASTSRPLVLGPEQVGTFSLRLTAPADAGQGVQRLEIRFEAEDDPAIARSTSARLILPGGEQ
ncbi:MAG TPA: cytochrome c oxidase accessory protein CcoG [Xanthomonadales bacterium]|nr:cytochrome c oxidase accessory protein CcoG [Xanthomonadales bacterium]